MKRTVLCAVFFLLAGLSTLAQDTVTVISIKANVRGTPTAKGIVVTTVDRGESFELIKEKSPWYLIQTPKFVGWIHGNSIRVGDDLPDLSAFEKYVTVFDGFTNCDSRFVWPTRCPRRNLRELKTFCVLDSEKSLKVRANTIVAGGQTR